MDKKTYAIGLLSVTALVLLVANLLAPRQLSAIESVNDRDYQLVTARVKQGGDALYILDNASGRLAAITVTPGRGPEVAAVQQLTEVKPGRGAR